MSDLCRASDARLEISLLACVMLLSACAAKEPPARPPPEIKVVEVVQRDTILKQDFVGQTLGSTEIPIRARVQGVLESQSFIEGSAVTKGQLLYVIDGRPFRAKVVESEGRLAESLTQLAKATADLARVRPLAEMQAVSQQDLDAAVAQRDAALGSVKASEANLELANIELGYASIYSPIDGNIGISEAGVGEFVGASPNPVVLNNVSLTDPIRVRFSINEREYLRFKRELVADRQHQSDAIAKKRTSFGVELILADGTTHNHIGRVVASDAVINPDTGTFMLEADFPNPDTIVTAGQFARARIAISTIPDALLVPQRALTELQGQFRAFVVDSEGAVSMRSVKLGAQVGRLTIVESGLVKGERVAIEGLLSLKNGAVVSPALTQFSDSVPSISKTRD